MSRIPAGSSRFARPLLCAFSSLLFLATASVAATDTSVQVADYYYARYAYRQALPLWLEVARKQPSNLSAVLRVAELKLLSEGREASRNWLRDFLTREGHSMSPESLQVVGARLTDLQETFLTDEGQTLFYQALARIRREDCEGAIPGLIQAINLEKGNIRLTKEKARCEKMLGQFQNYYESLNAIYVAVPLQTQVQEDLAEAHLNFHHPELAVAMFDSRLGESLKTPRARLIFGLALLEQGKTASAHLILEPLVHGREVRPILYYGMGKILSQKTNTRAVAVHYLEQFVASAKPSTNAWDPYHVEERLADAKALLLSLRGSGATAATFAPSHG